MVGYIKFDGPGTATGQVSNAVTRAELNVSPAHAAELPDVAVSASAKAQALPPEFQPQVVTLGSVRSESEAIHHSEERDKMLAEIEAKLLVGRTDIRKDRAPGGIEELLARADAAMDPSADEEPEIEIKLPGSGTSEPAQVKRDAHGDRDHILEKVENALNRIGRLRRELAISKNERYDRLLALTASVSGLNFARSRIADSDFSIASASDTVDMIMANVKTAVVAHGKASADIVRLVIGS